MKYLISFGLASIWCIFGCGCHSSHIINVNNENLEQYHLGEYVDACIDRVYYKRNKDRLGAKHSTIHAHKNWQGYLRGRHHRESTYKLSHFSRVTK